MEVNGQYSKKYTGIYNFLLVHNKLDPISNGLAWASSGRTYKRAWTTPQKSIEGGAEYIGEKYINCGQYTTYFQRFNVNAKSTYGLYQHQYMTNVYGAASEASISSDAYEDMGIAKLAKTFIIPVYKGMPSTTAKVTLGKSYKS
ncbi:MAG: peptide-binding protein, partial [Eubacterium sp.]